VSDRYTYPNTYANSNADTYANANSNSNADADSYPDTYSNADTNAASYSAAASNPATLKSGNQLCAEPSEFSLWRDSHSRRHGTKTSYRNPPLRAN
jgi:hypothetical protein